MWHCSTKMGSEPVNSESLKLTTQGQALTDDAPTSTFHATTLQSGATRPASGYIDWDVWQPPKPWSPKALTPVGKFSQSYFDYTNFYAKEDSGYYGSPQVDWTPPKLPACAHSTPGHLAGVSDTTPQGATPSTPRNTSVASSGYGSNCSALLGFSPTSFCLEGFDASFDLASLTPSPVKYDDQGASTVEGVDHHKIKETDSDADIIYTGMTPAPASTQHDERPTLTPLPENNPAPASPPTPTPSTPPMGIALPAPQPSPATATALTKPKEPYFSLIAKAILQCPERRLILADIYDHLQEKFPYFLTAETSWRNVVRHNLSVNECFTKAGRAESGRGYYWGIHPACVDMFQKGDFRRREAKKMVQLHDEKTGVGKKENIPPVNQGPRAGHVISQATPMTAGGGVVRGGYQYCSMYGASAGYHQGNTGQYNGAYRVNTLYPGQYNNPSTYSLHTLALQAQGNSYDQAGQHQNPAWKRQRLA